MKNTEYMKIAIDYAKKGRGYVNPNPIVGAVITKNAEVIGVGYHEKYGGLHAERNAITSCIESPKGATMYVTLEPCCHYGKTPPCTNAIIESGIKKVVIGTKDPNPIVSGKGIEILRKNGVEVVTNVLESECNKLNEIFFHYIKWSNPFVTLKYAMTLDGKIATYLGKSKWITGEEAIAYVHKSRHKYSSIMIGVETVIEDNPLLTCRLENGISPSRVICDTNLRTPIESQVVKTADEVRTYIATACVDEEKQRPFIEAGCKLIIVSKKNEHLDLEMLMKKLGKEKIDSVLLEGGSELNYSALKAGIVNKVNAYVSPKIFGGKTAKSPVGGIGVEFPNEAIVLENREVKLLGEDILIKGDIESNVYRNR